MKINKIGIKNFRNHQLTTITMDKTVNLFLGKNNNGKSSIKAALEMVLTGGCEFTGDKGQGYQYLIKTGTKQTIVSADVEGVGEIEKRLGKSKSIYLNGDKSTQTEIESLIESQGVSINVIKAIFSSSKFINMTANEKKNFMFNLLNIDVDIDLIINNLSKQNTEAIDRIKSSLPSELDMTVFDTLYDIFYSDRRNLNKEIKVLQMEVEKLKQDTFDYADSTYDEIKTEKIVKGKEFEEIQKQIAIVENSKFIYDSATKEKEEVLEESEKLNKLLIQYMDITTSIDDINDSINQYNDKIKNLEVENKELEIEMASRTSKINLTKNIIQKLKDTGCPLYSKLTCNQDKNAMVDELTNDMISLQDELFDLEMDAEYVKSQINKENLKLEGLKNDLNTTKTIDRIKSSLDILKVKLSEIEKRLVPVDDKELPVLKDKESSLKLRLQEINTYLKNKTEYDQTVVKLMNKEKELVILEFLVSEFNSDGIKNKILKHKVQDIKDKANERLSVLTGSKYKLDFDLTEGFDVIVTHETGTVKVQGLSDSEKLRIGIILQDIFSYLTNSKILVIDNLEILDEENRTFFNDFINNIKDEYNTILLIGTGDESQFMIDDSNYFIVDNGEVFDLFA
ncbi:AAA family ATPase [Alkaliphilus sp. B6464]|uniref:AAA family ATPase n=1 Tax=Alkaliphilus sp. B6464 TaxID=2731219 RepID=UPI001BAE4CF4|nr:AAA family ATPase [Alkaliphilus sp. B6464]QUH22069.1 AAA family ATPase [Alkaliphilus sp. B6464]